MQQNVLWYLAAEYVTKSIEKYHTGNWSDLLCILNNSTKVAAELISNGILNIWTTCNWGQSSYLPEVWTHRTSNCPYKFTVAPSMPQHIMPVHFEAYTNKQLVGREGGRGRRWKGSCVLGQGSGWNGEYRWWYCSVFGWNTLPCPQEGTTRCYT